MQRLTTELWMELFELYLKEKANFVAELSYFLLNSDV